MWNAFCYSHWTELNKLYIKSIYFLKKYSLEKGKIIEKDWNDNKLNSLINDCLEIENNIIKINVISDKLNNLDELKYSKIIFCPDENGTVLYNHPTHPVCRSPSAAKRKSPFFVLCLSGFQYPQKGYGRMFVHGQ